MSESKGDIKGLASSPKIDEISDISQYFSDTEHEPTNVLIRTLLNESIASKIMVPFDITSSKIRLYGQPLTMAQRSPLIASMLDVISYKEPTSLAISVTVGNPKALLQFWLYLNGLVQRLDPRLETWEWINYFGIDLKSDAVKGWIVNVGREKDSKEVKEYKGDRSVMCQKLVNMFRMSEFEDIKRGINEGRYAYSYRREIVTGLSAICGRRIEKEYLEADTYEVQYSPYTIEDVVANQEFITGMVIRQFNGYPRIRLGENSLTSYSFIESTSKVESGDIMCDIAKTHDLKELLSEGFTQAIVIGSEIYHATQDMVDGFLYANAKMAEVEGPSNVLPFKIIPVSLSKC